MRTWLSTIPELARYLRASKRWWLTPLVITLVVVGALLLVVEASTFLPFLYPLF